MGPLPHEGDERVLFVEGKGPGLLAQLELGDLLADLFGTHSLPRRERKTCFADRDDGVVHLPSGRLPGVPELGDPPSEGIVLLVEPLDLDLGRLAAVVDRLLLRRDPTNLHDQILPTVEEGP